MEIEPILAVLEQPLFSVALGGLIATATQLVVSHKQQKRESSQWQRDQRTDAYRDYLKSMHILRHQVWLQKDLDSTLEVEVKYIDEADQAMASLLLVGSTQVRREAQKVFTTLRRFASPGDVDAPTRFAFKADFDRVRTLLRRDLGIMD